MGCGKTPLFKEIVRSIENAEERFPQLYRKKEDNGADFESGGIISNVTGLGLRKLLTSSNKNLFIHVEFDVLFNKYGIFYASDQKCDEERVLLLNAFDG
ncbi:unnamed protein product [Didymodactylos carnosus]|uniref:Uncharacterized protein n=1 Tax=Didymodactylos carnosus TaxID=1234261 RepID=A0A815JI93_9BILA|nr:unnamed protein product [Didymodactylos carnosus]CAF4268159.1 unnamed protein product [Didymodactylos carnosus]CAF4406848.1 unnamed protein product [Didymodactylos carnosus]